MKKIFLIGLAATAMLASCSNDETVEMAQNTKAIGFSSFIDKSTRATDTDLTNLATIEVYGWRGDAQIFDKQEVTVEASGAGTYSPIQYWEPNYTYAFEAIAPKSGEKGIHLPLQKMVVQSLLPATLKPTCFIQRLMIKQQIKKLLLIREKLALHSNICFPV